MFMRIELKWQVIVRRECIGLIILFLSWMVGNVIGMQIHGKC